MDPLFDQAIPRLRTQRLILRAPVLDDFPAFAALMASPRSEPMGGPFDTPTAWGLFCHGLALWPLMGHGAMMIDLDSTVECVGQLDINHGPLFPEKELGWQVYEAHEGKGRPGFCRRQPGVDRQIEGIVRRGVTTRAFRAPQSH